jgi:tetratricopeptide (TPR) repeat protein
MNRSILLILCLFAVSSLWAQNEYFDIKRGNKEYKNENYTASEVNYRRGLEANKNSFEGYYNLGNALYRQDKFNDAIKAYEQAASILASNNKMDKTEKAQRTSAIHHNIGNAYYVQQQFDKAISAYQEALRHNPKDDETRYNLVKAMQQLRQQQNQPQQQNDSTQQQPQQQQPQENNMDPKTAEQILQALEQDEQNVQEKRQYQQGEKGRLEKNW